MKKIYLALLLYSCAFVSQAQQIWVSPSGNDTNGGTKTSPKATLYEAVKQIREMRRTGHIKDTAFIYLTPGVYTQVSSLTLRPEDSGTEQFPLVIKGVLPGKAVISGGIKLSGWKKQGRYWVSEVPDFNGYPLDFRQMWVNGRKAVRARDVQNFGKMYRILSCDNIRNVLWVPAEAVRRIQKAPYAEMVLHEMWCVANLRIRSITMCGDSAAVAFHQPESDIQFSHPWPRPMVTPDGHNSAFYLTNAMELLDVPGEWYHDIRRRKVYYMPSPGEDMARAEVIVPAVETLVQVKGDADRRVHDIIFDNVSFSYTTWMRPSRQGHVPLQAGMYLMEAYRLNPVMKRKDGNHNLDNQGWTGRPGAAVSVRGGVGISFVNCRFEHLGSGGLDYTALTQGGMVRGCLFRDIAGNGILAGYFGDDTREAHLPYDPADRRMMCAGLNIENNYITDVTNEDWGTLGICAGFVRDIRIAHNEISEVSYSGISLGWGWNQDVCGMRNNRVENNLIHHYARHMYDVAGIYTLGAQPKTLITGNCVHSIYSPGYAHDPEHWFYLYTDEGSSFITVRDNWTESMKFLKNANGPCNVWENNGPEVDMAVKENAGLEKKYHYLKTL